MNYNIVFFDVDGTITHHVDGSISDSTRDAISRLKEKGLVVVAATGRPLSMCQELRELGIDTFITANGAYVKHQEQVIHQVLMKKEIVKAVVEFSVEHSLSFYTEEFFTNGVKDAKALTALNETLLLSDYPPLHPAIDEQDVYLMCLFADDVAVEKYKSRFPELTFKRWHPYVLNVLDEDVNKSLAIKKVLQYFNLDPSEAIAFGDGENDIDMLELVGLGIAMGNGSENLKQVADFVTKKSSEDGIEYALKKLGIL